MADTSNAEQPSIIDLLRKRLVIAERWAEKPVVALGELALWSTELRNNLEKIYGKESPLLRGLPPRGIDRTIVDPKAELLRRIETVRRIIKALEAVPDAAKTPLLGRRIFIGHGRSLVWYQLKDFIITRVGLACDEFNIEPAAGISTTARLDAMLEQAGFAFVVMTAEEEHADGRFFARPNVIHESGLFQGKLGTRRAIILLEEGCSDFSNIAGLTQIRFPKDNLIPAFDDVRRVLEREGLI